MIQTYVQRLFEFLYINLVFRNFIFKEKQIQMLTRMFLNEACVNFCLRLYEYINQLILNRHIGFMLM